MKILSYFETEDREHWYKEIGRSDWNAAPFLQWLIREERFFETLGERSRLLLLTEGDELISFCTYSETDDIPDTELTPWIGFVYTFPAHRGHRNVGKLIRRAEEIAAEENAERVYISTDHTGLYEKYGYSYFTSAVDIHGNSSRIYSKEIQKR